MQNIFIRGDIAKYIIFAVFVSNFKNAISASAYPEHACIHTVWYSLTTNICFLCILLVMSTYVEHMYGVI